MSDGRPSTLPAGYRQGVVTAITVFLGFSMAFLQFWGIENPGDWTFGGVLCAILIAAGTLVQLAALFRALDVRDEEVTRYERTVALFRTGVVVVMVGVVASILVAARS
jgi:hypothetical protein